jgi:hypothetical protein
MRIIDVVKYLCGSNLGVPWTRVIASLKTQHKRPLINEHGSLICTHKCT